jgi:hypothetical protein
MGRTEADRKDYERAVVVNVQKSKRTTKITLRSERSSALKKDLTGPTLLEMSGNGYQALAKLNGLDESHSREPSPLPAR